MTDIDTQKQLKDSTAIVREWAGSEASRAIMKMLDDLGQAYFMSLADVKKEDLEALQAKLKQVHAIRTAVAGQGLDVPMI